MANKIQFKRGSSNQIPELAYGEPGFVSDEKELYIGTESGTNIKLTNRKEMENIAINIKTLGAKGDGIADDTNVIQTALNMGGNIFIPAGTYKITKELKVSISNTKIFGYGINKSILKYEGKGIEGFFLSVNGINADEYIENVVITGITIDGTNQWYKGGNSDDTPKETSPSPKYHGMVGIYAKYAKHLIIEDVIMNDIYGDGIKIRRSCHCIINRNTLYDCGGGNIIRNEYTGWDNYGDAIVAFYSYNVDISNNIIINKRIYLTHENDPGNVNDVYGLPCGRSGLEFEYRINEDSPSTNPNNHPYYNAPGYNDFNTRDGFGLNMINNYVYGYTKGIHLEADVRCLISSNKMIKNHIGILHSGGALTHIINNYITNEGLTRSPQIGYDAYCGGIAITAYSIANLVLVDGNIIDITTVDKSKKIQAITIGRACVRITNNSINTDFFGIYEVAEKPSATTKGVIILNNEFSTKSNNNVIFIFKYYSHAEWIISSNSFTNSGVSNNRSSLVLHSENKLKNGGLFINNNIFNNVQLDIKHLGYNVDILNNTFYALANFVNNESLINCDNMNNVKIENNRFYIHEDAKVKHCISLKDNSEFLSIRKNSFNIANDFMTICCYLPNNVINLTLEKNIIETPANNFVFSIFNWSVRNPIIKENRISNPHCNCIAQTLSSASIHGLVDIYNNTGLIRCNIDTNHKYEGLFIPLGFVFKDHSQNINKTIYGEVCVVEGVYTKNIWNSSTKYTTENYVTYNDIVYKVNSDFTSGSIFDSTNLTEMGKLCKFKTINLV